MAPFLAGMSAYQDCYEQRCHYLLILTAFILAKIDLLYDPLYWEAWYMFIKFYVPLAIKVDQMIKKVLFFFFLIS